MEGYVQLVLEGAEDHGVAAVFGEEWLGVLLPVAVNVAVVAFSDADGIAVGAEAGPEHEEAAVGAAMKEGAVGDVGGVVALAARRGEGVLFAPWGVGGGEEIDGSAGGAAEVVAEWHGADRAVVDLQPFVAEDDVGRAVVGDEERAVEALPVLRRRGAVADGREGAGRGVGREDLRSAVVVRGFEGGEEVVLVLVGMDFGCPVVAGGPEVRRRGEDADWFGPMLVDVVTLVV